MNTEITNRILLFFNKRLKENEAEVLKENLSNSEDNRKLFDEYNEIIQASNVHQFYDHVDFRWEELSEKINFKSKKGSAKRLFIKPLTLQIWKSAAVIALLISFTLTGYYMFKKSENAIVSVKTQRGQKSEILLADGSKIWLNSGSELINTEGFSMKNRTLSLNGEAYFQVKKNSKSPFTVNLGDTKITVYGTRFNVSSYQDDEDIIASLEEGSIGFTKLGLNKPVLIKPGEQLVYSKSTGEITVRKVNIDLYTSWKENKLKFSNATFLDVVKKMERWYDVNIIIDPEFQYSERFTMTIKTESLKEMMEILQSVSNITFKIETDTVYIYKKGGENAIR
jgi:ferric-dicitrate binding protein FerR (iron transport regulator)